MLLFGKARLSRFPDAWIQAGRFAGTDRRRVLDSAEIRTCLPIAVADAIAFVHKHSTREAVIGKVKRADRWTIPSVAIREAVINAFVHADYSQHGAPIRIALFDDRLEIENPGMLPFGLTLDDIRRGVSKLRNRVIGRVFQEIGLIEQWGSGLQRMTAACRDEGLADPKLEELGTHFRVTLSAIQTRTPYLDPRDKSILTMLKNAGDDGLGTAEIARRLSRPPLPPNGLGSSFQETPLPLTNFTPKTHGFHFANDFVTHIIGDLKTTGLCGGMVFASLDYYYVGLPIPTHAPAEGSRLRKYIFKRMMHSVERNALQWANIIANPVFNPKRFTKRHLDAGRPVPLGLVGSLKIGNAGSGNHQVVCCGYSLSPGGYSITLNIYDNNSPDKDITLTTDSRNPVNITYTGYGDWFAFFMAKYKAQQPDYIDLALTEGIQLDLNGPARFQVCGRPMGAHYRVRNCGEYPARLSRLVMKMRDPSGDESIFAVNDVTTIAPSSEASVGKDLATFPDESGGYDLRAEYISADGTPIRIPAHAPGTDNDVPFSAVPPGTRPRTIVPGLVHA
jgi:hypothetical protein